MTPIKRLIDKITGGDEPSADGHRIRAFGKLPSGREFQQLEAGQGPAKLFQDWLHQGHASWIRRVPAENRGKVASTCLLWPVPDSRKQVIIASIWNSRDSASPSRVFPFALLITLPFSAKTDWLHRFAMCSRTAPQFAEQFKALFNGDRQLSDLRESSIAVLSTEVLSSTVDQLTDQARAIQLSEWFKSLAAAHPGLDAQRFVGVLRQLVQRWEASAGSDVGVRLPLSRSFPFDPQVCAWLRWLQNHLQVRTFSGVSIFAPCNGAVANPAVAVLTRPSSEGDVQLATTDAPCHPTVDDAATAAQQFTPRGEPGSVHTMLRDESKTLWDWACERIVDSPQA